VNTKVSKKNSKAKQKKSKSNKPEDKLALRNKPLCVLADEALNRYFDTLNGHHPIDLHQFVMGQVEKPLLERVMTYTNGNQSVAAEILGMNRGTLRKRLQCYKLL